ncbi:unnamed protein product [Macrosiphum euphorbiae]|uniref:Uncharacterized protein n=1 Tax=Macrosiphum euphorbiae TaxID=13131 RepID=A0AAV0WDF5_9HEMI|nr:unnamed protein product [Macrosiphum euphorbiae]
MYRSVSEYKSFKNYEI